MPPKKSPRHFRFIAKTGEIPYTIDLAWFEDRQAYEIRLLKGKTFITPKLEITPAQLWTIHQEMEGVELVAVPWGSLKVHRRLKDLGIEFSDPSTWWPPTDYSEFLAFARHVRGESPFEGGYPPDAW